MSVVQDIMHVYCAVPCCAMPCCAMLCCVMLCCIRLFNFAHCVSSCHCNGIATSSLFLVTVNYSACLLCTILPCKSSVPQLQFISMLSIYSTCSANHGRFVLCAVYKAINMGGCCCLELHAKLHLSGLRYPAYGIAVPTNTLNQQIN